MTTRQRVLKTALWTLIGGLVAVTVARFRAGLGATTGLSDAAPWGLWIAFDVMAGVALAAGGFVLAGTVYIFGLERYRPFVRPAVLTAFLGYVAVATGLLYDLGLPWNIWHPAIYPQPHSVLFEVAMCVMLYLTVLLLEFAPVVLEHPAFDRPLLRNVHRGLKKAGIFLVIVGIVLSTLHQSSLGSLYLITPFRLHPLWYTPLIWVLFFVSAVGLGLMMVTLESYFSAWLFGHKLRMDLLPSLGKAASVVLLLYAALRLGDLGARGMLSMALDGSPLASLFLFELALSAVVPGLLLAMARVRNSPRGLGVAALMTVLGMIGYRFDVCVVAFERPEGMSYFPSWMELAVSLGIVAGALLVFIFFVEKLQVYPQEAEAAEPAYDPGRYNPASMWPLTPDSLAAPRRHSLALVVGISAAVAFLPTDALFGAQPLLVLVHGSRTVNGLMTDRMGTLGHELTIVPPGSAVPPGAHSVSLMLIDGNQDGRLVLFAHDLHVAELGEQDSCGKCHHQNLPFQENSGCYHCHRDMYSAVSIFDHSLHVAKLGDNRGCKRCHRDPAQVKSRQSAAACLECHSDMAVEGSRIRLPAEGMTGRAVGYLDAMHGLCITCHEERSKADPARYGEKFAECLNCHRDVGGNQVLQLPPYVNAQGQQAGGRASSGT
jgi:Ni/Fe-hydrogenase subunit HybB-like protein